MKKYEINFWYWLVRKLPKKIVYFSFMHVMAYATTGKYSSTIVPDLTGMEAIKRYSNDKKILSHPMQRIPTHERYQAYLRAFFPFEGLHL